ncbi:MBL fold metallo-hydrolase [Methylobacterium aerolatum]|uniref:Phosphoribosyl 1,2-cyclic phosphodiesterase n=1 Tax=Methylobacterium aerolatum TaxID=418708 RepID=A0ABU0I0Q5_9HYPH|nr:MBL fold metallo-hydrolase [Methylobacterium aerolatum]MDQ0448172.1 phosphoribosyl 1,2-cyclic phosphodiesterase [Methylobacterium aerolatum]GJD33962.1 Ribonuclease BN [Methylobacterium aerolatum]
MSHDVAPCPGAANDDLILRFWGVRGSTPVSGPQYAEFGGSTPCLEVRCGERLFVVDAGSGLYNLGQNHRADLPTHVDLLFSHLHLDHTTGLPFFKPAVLDSERTIHTWCGNLGGESAGATLDRLFSPPLFPIGLEDFRCTFRHHGFEAGQPLVFPDGIRVDTILLNHPQGSVGYKFEHNGRRLCIISDIEHRDPWPDPALAEFVAGVDLMIYDGMFTDCEYPTCRGWGHSTWQKGVELAQAAGVKTLGIIHLHPAHSDTVLRDMEADLQAAMPGAFIARECQTVVVGGQDVGDAQDRPAIRSMAAGQPRRRIRVA